MSFMKIRKSVQLKADPCGRPSSKVVFEDRVSFSLVWISLSVKKALTHEYIFPVEIKREGLTTYDSLLVD